MPLTVPRELLGHKAYDSNAVGWWLAALNIRATIPGRSHWKELAGLDAGSYQGRHLVGRAFSDRKQFRGLDCRYAELDDIYAGVVSLAAWFPRTKPNHCHAAA